MWSYRHAFHAGNHADVLKHLVLIQLLQYLGQKEKPFQYIDTHAGAGLYRLDTGYAQKSAEYKAGIARLWDCNNVPAAVADYLQAVKACNEDGRLCYYPGSPKLADTLLRNGDQLRLFEMHPADYKILQGNFLGQNSARNKRVLVQQSDGFAGLKALLPPLSRRGLILMDPSYEDKNDYRYVVESMADAISRFATGMYMVWYPVLPRLDAKMLPEKLKRLPVQNWLNVTLSIGAPAADGLGLHSSGLIVLNPPWTLAATLRETMPYLVKQLARDEHASFSLQVSEQALRG